MEEIYLPQEDSYFFSDILKKEVTSLLKKNPNLKVLEIGSGNGVQLETLSKLKINKKNIFSCDINKKSVEHCKKLGFNCIQSNLFSKINKKEKFNLIIFNPPYLPADKLDNKKDTTGGFRGDEIILKFLKQSVSHLNSNGKIFLLTSSFTPKIRIGDLIKKLNLKKKLLAKKKLFFEELMVWELSNLN